MYTKVDDRKMANKILFYIVGCPSATIDDIMKNCHTNYRRLKKLEAEGYIVLPKPTARGQRNKQYYEDKAIQSSGA